MCIKLSILMLCPLQLQVVATKTDSIEKLSAITWILLEVGQKVRPPYLNVRRTIMITEYIEITKMQPYITNRIYKTQFSIYHDTHSRENTAYCMTLMHLPFLQSNIIYLVMYI